MSDMKMINQIELATREFSFIIYHQFLYNIVLYNIFLYYYNFKLFMKTGKIYVNKKEKDLIKRKLITLVRINQ